MKAQREASRGRAPEGSTSAGPGKLVCPAGGEGKDGRERGQHVLVGGHPRVLNGHN